MVKDVYAVWELPIVFLLPGHLRADRAGHQAHADPVEGQAGPVYKRVYTVAAIGTAYGCARLVYLGVLPSNVDPRAYLWSHTPMWLVAAGAGAVTQWASTRG